MEKIINIRIWRSVVRQNEMLRKVRKNYMIYKKKGEKYG